MDRLSAPRFVLEERRLFEYLWIALMLAGIAYVVYLFGWLHGWIGAKFMSGRSPDHPDFVNHKPTIDELEKILNSEEGSDIDIRPDGSIGLVTDEMKAQAERDRIAFAFSELNRVVADNKRLKAAIRALTANNPDEI